MKKLVRLFAVAVAIIAVLVMAVPAFAVDTSVTIGSDDPSGSNAPYVVCKFETPDEVNSYADGINILPEAPIPPDWVAPDEDGWKQINFYLVVDDPDNDASITAVDIIVRYPDGSEKFNLHVNRVRGTGVYADVAGPYYWSISGGPGPEAYPTGDVATPPSPQVRELRYRPAGSWTVDNDGDGKLDGVVDGNADGDTNDAADLTVPAFLTAYGTNVTYGMNPDLDPSVPFTATTVTNLLTAVEGDGTGKAIMLEIISYIWCHQEPVWYHVEASAIAGDQSEPLENDFQFVPMAYLYLDFENIDWGTMTSPSVAYKDGDADLLTPLLPTVWNNGNFDGMVWVSATKMILDSNGNGVIDPAEENNANIDGKHIDCFDVHMDYIDPVTGEVYQMGTVFVCAECSPILISDCDCPVRLPPCTPTQIDFSLVVPSGLVNGEYIGKITLTIDNYCCE